MKRLFLAVLACLVLPFAAEAQKPTLDSFATATGAIPIGSTRALQFGGDTSLARTSANFMGVRNGTTAQSFSIYRTFTDSSNYRSLQMDAGSGRLITNLGGTGTAFDLVLGSGAEHWSIASSTGHLTSVLGSSDIRWGTTSSFPMLRRNGAALDIKLADNSTFAEVTAGTVRTVGYFHFSGSTRVTTIADGIASIFANNGTTGGVLELTERSDPTAGAANTGRLYVRDNGGGKSQLVVLFPTGAVQVIATEP